MKIIVVIPNWDGADHIADCLKSLEQQTLRHQVVVVDNGSVDNSVEIIERDFPKVHIIKLPVNTGFSGGVNTGWRYAIEQDCDAVAILNNDARADKDWLKHLASRLMSDDKIGIVCPKQLQMDGTHFDCTGGFYSVWGVPFPRDRNLRDKGQRDTAEEVFSAPGGAPLYRVALLKKAGLFDEKFFAYYEDDDLSFRARLHGWEIWYEPAAIVHHHISATSSRLGSFTRYHATKNFFLLYAKNMPGYLYWKYLPLFIMQALFLAAGSIRHGAAISYLKGFAKVLWLTPHIYRERRKIQRSRSVSPASIDMLLYHHRPPKIPKIKTAA